MSLTEERVRLGMGTMTRLRPEVRTPRYDRGALESRTVHLGVGGFHRAHQAVYLDDLLQMDGTPRWGESGIGVLPSDDRMRDALRGQDCLYTVVERSAGEPAARVIGSMVDYMYAPEERERAIDMMAAAATRIVSLTITEGGYYIDEGTGAFLAEHPDIEHDVRQPEAAKSSMGLIAEALDRRRLRGLPGLTVMSCDNLQGNGHVVERVLLGYAGLRKPELRDWIAANVAFPNSMVDRITPQTTAADVAFVAERFGIEDRWPVVTEPFRQWVIEDTFANGRPEWERVGGEMVADVAPYELMKMRLLNGSHLAMAYLGALAGYRYVHEIMADPLFTDFIRAFMEQVTPVVPVIPGTSVTDYKATLIARFRNPTINDQVTRICSEGSTKLPKWLLPSIAELMETGRPTGLLSLVVASWIFYLGRGVDQRGMPLETVDARAGELREIASSAGLDPRPVLAVRSIFGERLPAKVEFVRAVEEAVGRLSQEGVEAAIRHSLAAARSR